MVLLTLFAFVAGAGTALSPCSLPVLPALLSASATGGRRRPIGIVLGLAVTFCLTIVGLATVVDGVGLGTSLTRSLAVAALGVFGLALVVPALGRRLEAPLMRLSRLGPKDGGDGFVSGLAVGGALGFVHAPCAGPVLAAVIAVSATTGATVALGIAFSAGTAVTLLIIALTGRRLIGRFTGVRGGQRLQRGLGGVLVLTAVLMAFSLDVRFQQAIATHLPGFVANPTRPLETSAAVERRLADLRGAPRFAPAQPVTDAPARVTAPPEEDPPPPADGAALPVLGTAPEFTGTQRWFNSRPLTLAGQVARGHVTLVDFWTYTCINCLRTLPYLEAWDKRYRAKGLDIVGVHTPEFSFEKSASNVKSAVARLGVRYPVVQDNDMATWNAWGNQYWPASYLVDAKGKVRYVHFGEGDDDKTEAAIRSVLAERGATGLASGTAEPAGAIVPSQKATPETYLGTERTQGFVVPPRTGLSDYRRPTGQLERNAFALGGRWRVSRQAATAARDASIDVQFTARDVYLVLSPPPKGTGSVRVFVDGKLTRTVTVRAQRLEQLVHLPRAGSHRLTLRLTPGVAAYAFTFG